jgi:demethylmenaquinone methyltransferase/2-methoxy-6-polyprenyl-1,4-benzoquinol methylase
MISREQTRQNYDRMSRWYDLFAGSEKKFTESGLQMLGVKAGERVLEIGFGTGHSLIRLAQEAGEGSLVAGVELSAEMIAIARKRMYPFGHKQAEGPESCARMIQGDGTRLPFVSHSFDAVFLSFMLELFSDVEIPVVLEECQRILKPQGRLGAVSLAKQDVLACRLYEWGHERWPALLDCRPIHVRKSLEAGGFRVQAAKVQTMWGLPVEIVLGRPEAEWKNK